MKRRTFLLSSLTTGTMYSSFGSSAKLLKFPLNFAPKMGMFANHAKDELDQLQFIADQGFTAFEDSGIANRPVQQQNRISQKAETLNLKTGSFLSYLETDKPTFVLNDTAFREELKILMKSAVETAKRINTKWTTIIPGAYHTGMEWEYQMANAIDNFKRCVDICEPAGVTIIIEPLNRIVNAPGIFLNKTSQAVQLCRAVDSPLFKILYDFYHQQITEGNIINTIDNNWDDIVYYQVGDPPGRFEPTTGEINFSNIFNYLKNKEYKGIIGMDHNNSKPGKEGEKALIEAYRDCIIF